MDKKQNPQPRVRQEDPDQTEDVQPCLFEDRLSEEERKALRERQQRDAEEARRLRELFEKARVDPDSFFQSEEEEELWLEEDCDGDGWEDL